MGKGVLGSKQVFGQSRVNSVTVYTACGCHHGTLQHALSLAKALAGIVPQCYLIGVDSADCTGGPWKVEHGTGALLEHRGGSIPCADLSVVVGLWHPGCLTAAKQLATDDRRFVVVPTVYDDSCRLSEVTQHAEALWYVSWDQALATRSHWGSARKVEVLPCAVDISLFRPAVRASGGRRWILCRHSRDALEKFSPEVFRIVKGLENEFDITFKILGGSLTLGRSPDPKIVIIPQGSMETCRFLQDADLWTYLHAPYWKETACIAMLEAMACGLPVLVSCAGGMREYLVHGVTGFACANMDEMIDFTRLLLSLPALRLKMGIAAREHVTSNFSLAAMQNRLSLLL